MAFKLDPGLRQFATDRQWEILTTYAEAKSGLDAAIKLGLHPGNIPSTMRTVRKKAARAGYMPGNATFGEPNPPGVPVPDGFVLRGQSALVGPDGKMQQRWDKTRQSGRDPEEATRLPDPKRIVKLSTLYDADGNVTQQWVSERPEDVARETAWRAFAAGLARDLPRLAPIPAPSEPASHLMACYPVGDHHLGMLSWREETGADYDLAIGEELLTRAVGHLVAALPSCERATVAFLGDFLHYDSFDTVTPTSRNLLDADGRYPKMIDAAIRLIRNVIDAALARHARVHVIFEIGNHDLSSAIVLTQTLAALYEREPRLTFDTSPRHFHYVEFGRCLVGTHHGHGAKIEDLPLIMAADQPEAWGRTTHRYWWTGHVHHDRARDIKGTRVESFSVLPPQDAWSANKGYRAARAMQAMVLHREYGETSRYRFVPAMLDDAA